MNKKLLIGLKLLFGFSIIFTLFYKIGFVKIYNVLITTNIYYFIFFLLIILITNTLSIVNINLLLRAIGYKLPFIRVLKYYYLSWSFGMFFPGKLGEFSLAYFLKKENISFGEGIVISLIDKIITFIVMSALATIGFFLFLEKGQAIRLMILLVLILAISLIFLLTNKSRSLIKKYLLRKYETIFARFSQTFFYIIRHRIGILILNYLITVLRIFIAALGTFMLFSSFNQHVPLFYVMVLNAVVTISGLIPITVNGLGINQSMAVILYSLVGVDAAITAGVFTIILIANYLSALLFFSSAGLIKEP